MDHKLPSEVFVVRENPDTTAEFLVVKTARDSFAQPENIRTVGRYVLAEVLEITVETKIIVSPVQTPVSPR